MFSFRLHFFFLYLAYDDPTQATIQQQSSDVSRSTQALHNYQQATMKNQSSVSYNSGGGVDKSMYGTSTHPQMKVNDYFSIFNKKTINVIGI